MLAIETTKRHTRESLARIKCKRPREASEVCWDGTQHHQLIEMVCDAAENIGAMPGPEVFAISRNKYDIYGTIAVDHFDILPPPQMTLFVGVRSSLARRCRTRLAAGAYNPRTGFGFMMGEVYVGQQYTGRWAGRNVRKDLGEAMRAWLKLARSVPRRYEEMIEVPVTANQAARTMLHAARKGVISWSHLRYTDDYWRKPNTPKTVWGLACGLHLAIAMANPPFQYVRHLALTKILENLANLTVPSGAQT